MITQRGAAQFESSFARLSPQDVDIRECSFDPGASAVILLDEGTVDYDSFGEIDCRHTRIKILRNDALELAKFAIHYYCRENNAVIENLKAMSINIHEDGTSHEYPVDKKSIHDKKVNAYSRIVNFVYPEVKIGTILEFQYSIHYSGYGKPDNWAFQREYPVCSSSLKVKMPSFLPITYSLQKWPASKVVIEEDKDRRSYYFEMKNVPSLAEEPFMDSRETYAQKVNFHRLRSYDLASWKAMSSSLMEADWFGKQLAVRLTDPENFIAASVASKTDLEKISFVYNYVKNNITWNGYDAIAPADGLRKVWNEKRGNTGAINLLLVKFLRVAGLDAYPILVSERGNGKINTTRAYTDQFNTLYAVVYAGNQKYYLDATKIYLPWNLIPYMALNSTAFILDNKKEGLTDIREDSVSYREDVAVDCSLSPAGTLEGNVQVLSKDYARQVRVDKYMDNKEEYVEKILMGKQGNVSIKDFVAANEQSDSLPFKQNFAFVTNMQITGDYTFLDLNLFSDYRTNPFSADQRYSDIDFGFRQSINQNLVCSIPAGYKIEAIPKSVTLTNANRTATFSRTVMFNDQSGQVVSRIRIEMTKSVYPADEYADIRDFYKKMFVYLNEPVVLKKP